MEREEKIAEGRSLEKDQHQGVLKEKVESGKDSGKREDQESTTEARRSFITEGQLGGYRLVKKSEKSRVGLLVINEINCSCIRISTKNRV